MGQAAKTFGIGIYRAGLLAGVGGVLWFQTHFVTKESFANAMDANTAAMVAKTQLDATVVEQLKWRLDTIERKLDQIQKVQPPPSRPPRF